MDVLIVDDWAMSATGGGRTPSGFLEICDERYLTRSTLLTSQLPVAKWHARIGDPTVADSILDRLVHAAHRIELQGESACARRRADTETKMRSNGRMAKWFSEALTPVCPTGSFRQRPKP